MVTAVVSAPVLEGLLAAREARGLALQAAKCANSTAIATTKAAAKLSVQAIISGLFTAVGLYKQYDALGKQGDLFAAQKDITLRNLALSERTFNETFLPSYKAANDYFEKGFRKQWEPILVSVVACGTKACEYIEDYERHAARAVVDVGKIVAAAKRMVNTPSGCFAAGACFNQDYRFAELEQRLAVDARNLGRAYEEDFKFKKDTFYWNRLTTSASIAQNIGSLASNLAVQGKGSLINGLQTITQAAAGFDKAVGTGLSTLGNEGAFYGGLGASVSGLFNQRDSLADGQALLNASATRGLPAGADLYSGGFSSGPAYQAGGVDYSIANMQTVNNSGLSMTNRGFGIDATIESINGLN